MQSLDQNVKFTLFCKPYILALFIWWTNIWDFDQIQQSWLFVYGEQAL